jgi:hypothetical protein
VVVVALVGGALRSLTIGCSLTVSGSLTVRSRSVRSMLIGRVLNNHCRRGSRRGSLLTAPGEQRGGCRK